TAAAAGEHRWGAGAGTQNMVYLTISTGVGGGVIVDGRLYRGAGGNGGELGHVTVDWHGRPCRGCGRRGCLEAYVSGTSIAERAQEAGLSVATAEEVAAAARSGDPLAAAVWDETVEALACGLTSIVNLFEPELVVLGGGSAADAQHLAGELVGRYKRDRRPLAATALSVDPSVVTCIANDYEFAELFARQVEALARPGDLAIGFTTSGRSENVLRGLRAA